ncbi:MAG: RNA methyltransferase, partial [Deltaproteobacteria bacterium]|nr:RNA methyltransferase [Deltaproteobacteria bacterium]
MISLASNNRIALLFGPEDRGLTNEDLQFCHSFVNIPTAAFSSINLVKAVMIICHEIFSAQKQKQNEFMPKLANRHELDGMYDQLTEILTRISFLNPQNPDYWMNNIRSFFSRLQLRAKEVKII